VTVSVADIDRWNAGDVREVFHATRSRAEAAREVANGIAQLPAFGTWGGDASQAAKESINQTRKDLDAHGAEALAVARAADRAADDIEALKGKLANLRDRAHQLGMELNTASNTFVPVAGSNITETDAALAEAELQPQRPHFWVTRPVSTTSWPKPSTWQPARRLFRRQVRRLAPRG
jgi:hypothetical protein